MLKGSSVSVGIRLRRLNKDRVIGQIREGVERLEGVLCAVLFGSLVSGEYTGSSDADLLIIIDRDLPSDERYRRYNRIMADTDVQLFIFTLDKVVSRIRSGDTFIINIITTGIPIKGKDLFMRLEKLCGEAMRHYGIKKIDSGWVVKKK